MRKTFCRMCKGENLHKFLDLGEHPPSDAFLKKEDTEREQDRHPLDVFLCLDCGQAQLGFVVPPEILYRRSYPYESSTTRTGREHFFGLAKSIVERFHLNSQSLAVDVGSNVGVLLAGFKEQGTRILGIDPATDMAAKANSSGLETLAEFFGAKLAYEVAKKYGRAKAITATNVFAHVDNLDDVMGGIDALLDDQGVFVIEAPHFLDLVRKVEYDTIYHEHLSYLSVKPLREFFAKLGFELFDIEKHKIHGGTARYFVARVGDYPVSAAVSEMLYEEAKEGIHTPERLGRFARAVEEQKQLLLQLLKKIKAEGKKVVGVSAPAKGNTLLNHCGITTDLLAHITEKAQIKVGLFTPGTHIPIYDDKKIFEDQPDYAMILAWNFAEEIMSNLAEYKKRGGKFIIPIPKPIVV